MRRLITFLLILFWFGSSYSSAQTVPNGDLELWTDGKPTNWNVSVDGTDMVISQAVNGGETGHALQFVAKTNGSSADAYIEVFVTGITAGHVYDVNVRVKSNDDKTWIRHWDTRWFDASDTQVGVDFDDSNYNATTNNQWTSYLWADQAAPVNAVKLRIALRLYIQTGFVADFSNLLVENLTVTDKTQQPTTVENPQGLWATVASPTQIDLSWTKNAASDNVMLAYSPDGTFGTPQASDLIAGNTITGGGTVLYNGSNTSTSYSLTSLVVGATYYFKAWSVNGTNLSTGITANAYIAKPEPTNHLTNFTATGGKYKIDMTWTAATGDELPDGYLLKFSTTGYANITDPTDGVSESDLDMSDGTLEFMVEKDITLQTLQGIPPSTTLYVKAFPFTNTGTNINYKTDGTVPQAAATTLVAPDKDLFISEYCEGSSSNKYLEIYNPTNSAINLLEYKVTMASSGGGWGARNYSFGNIVLEAKEVLIIVNPDALKVLTDKTDIYSDVTYFNGDDAVAIMCNGYVIDQVGVPTSDPGTGWTVAGIANATVDHTLVRKPTVTTGNPNWTTSAGTDAANSEWAIYGIDIFDYLGFFGYSTDASLASLSIDGTAVATFAPATLIYTFELPMGTTAIPTVSATQKHSLASNPVITQATSLIGDEASRTATVSVTAHDGSSTNVYKVIFSVSNVLSNDASLSSIKISGTPLVGFAPATLLYTFEYEQTISTVPTVTITATHPNASTTITPATNLKGTDSERTTTIEVKAEDGTTLQTYKVVFNPKPLVSIYDIQFTNSGMGQSNKYQQIVTTKGIVTGKYPSGNMFTIQDGSGAWRGVWVYTSSGFDYGTINLGDELMITGYVEEYPNIISNALTEIKNVTTASIVKLSSGNTLPLPIKISAADAKTEQYEGVLVTVEGNVTNATAGYGEWEITDASGTVKVNDLGYAFVPILNTVYTVTGVLNYANSNFKVEPRFASDVEAYNITDATLKQITVNNQTISGFSPAVTLYTFELPFGTTTNPIITATTTDSKANVSSIIAPVNLNGTELERTATIDVVAEDNSTTAQYKVVFSIATFISNDATLSAIKVNTVDISGFDATTSIYTFMIEYSTEAIPTVTAVTNYLAANYVVTPATDLNGNEAARTTTIVVTAQNSTTTKTYSVVFVRKPLVSIYDIQFATAESPYKGQTVTTKGIVTGEFTNPASKYFTIQDGEGAWNGVWVFVPTGFDFTKINLGDEIMITAKVDEYYNLTNLKDFTYKVLTTGNPLPAAKVVSTLNAYTEQYEGVLIQTEGVCTVEKNNYNEWKINDGTGNYMADDMAYVFTPSLGISYRITGVSYYGFNDYKIEPRSADDVKIIIGNDATLRKVFVNGTVINGFLAGIYTYNIVLPVGTTTTPSITYETTHPFASATVIAPANLNGTEAERTATIDVVAEDGSSTSTYKVVFTVALDTEAPVFASTYPKTGTITQTDAQILVKMNEVGKVFYIVKLTSATAPTLAEVLASSNSIPITTENTEFTIALSGLVHTSQYSVYLVAADNAATPNTQATVSKVDFTTLQSGIASNAMLQFNIFPNPTENMLTIESNRNFVSMDIFAIDGKKIMSKYTSTLNETTINVSDLKCGMYILQLKDENGNVATTRFVKK